MAKFSCKKLTIDKHFDYSACISYDHHCNPLTMKYEIQRHFAHLRSKVNADKFVNALLALWTDFSGVTGNFKKNIVDAAMFYADKWTYKQQFVVYNCLLLLTFPFYRDVLKGIVDQRTGLFVAKTIEDYIIEKCSYDLSAATKRDLIAQVLGTMIELGVVKRFTNGTFIKSNTPVYDEIGVYAILKVAEALRASGEEIEWLWKCFNFEVRREFVSFFVDIDYAVILGDCIWSQFNEESFESLRLNNGEWRCGNGEFVYDNGSRITRRPRNSYVNIEDLMNAYGSEKFNGWSC